MDRLIVTGGRRLGGAVRINGAKNSALKLMAASLLAEGRTVIENVPRIVDCVTMGEVLERLGAAVGWDRSNLTIDTDGATGIEAPYLHGAFISLDFPSVGATENILMAAVGARGGTVIENAAREPEIQDLAQMLVEMGAKIHGAGTTSIEIDGVESFRPVRHAVVPDRIEAGTFAIAVCMTGGEITLQDAPPAHLDLALDKLTEAGGRIASSDGKITVGMDERPLAVDFVTLPYPGFLTDLQPQMMALLSIARGTSIITVNVFESRF